MLRCATCRLHAAKHATCELCVYAFCLSTSVRVQQCTWAGAGRRAECWESGTVREIDHPIVSQSKSSWATAARASQIPPPPSGAVDGWCSRGSTLRGCMEPPHKPGRPTCPAAAAAQDLRALRPSCMPDHNPGHVADNEQAPAGPGTAVRCAWCLYLPVLVPALTSGNPSWSQGSPVAAELTSGNEGWGTAQLAGALLSRCPLVRVAHSPRPLAQWASIPCVLSNPHYMLCAEVATAGIPGTDNVSH